MSWFCALLACGWATTALAQPVAPSRVEVSVGGGLFGGASLAGPDADLRGSSTPTYRLFASDPRLVNAAMLEARVAWRFARRYAVEGHGMYAGQDLRVSVTADAEGAPSVTVGERIDRYIVDVGLLVLLDELRVAGLEPFAVAGAGYVRQLHEETLVETGHLFHVGAGVKRSFFTRRGRFLDGIGVRGDARVYLFGQGIAGDDSQPPQFAATGSVVFAF